MPSRSRDFDERSAIIKSSENSTNLSVAVCRIIEESENEPRLKDLAKATGYRERSLVSSDRRQQR